LSEDIRGSRRTLRVAGGGQEAKNVVDAVAAADALEKKDERK
jgi:hypothetical protein